MKTISLTILLLITATSVHAQEISCLCDTIRDNPFKPELTGERFIWSKTGSVYFNTDFVNGDIKLINGEWVDNIALKYNGFIDEVIMFNTEIGKQIKLDKKFIQEFRFNDPQRNMSQNFKKVTTGLLSDSAEIFIQVLLEDRISLFVFRKIGITGYENKSLNGGMFGIEIYSPIPEYILGFPGGRIESFNRIKRKEIIKSFPGKEESIKEIFRRNHIWRIKDEPGLIDVIELLNKDYFSNLLSVGNQK